MNRLDRLIAAISPERAMRRMQARKVMALYEAATPNRTRKTRTDISGPNNQTQQGAVSLRTQARHLEQNHDLARGMLRILVDNVVGPKGIGIEPQPRDAAGVIDREYARKLRDAWRDWQRRPEVTWKHTWPKVQRLMARTWFRDGESLAQQLIGPVPFLDHGTAVPYSLELFEPDMLPYTYNDASKRISQGIQTNAWGRPLGYWVYKTSPYDYTGGSLSGANNLKFIPAERVLHLAITDRIGQMRGVSSFASVITRLEDIKDYEESERVAAKIAAMLTAYVKRGTPDMIDPENLPRDDQGNVLPREISLEPGAIIDTLQVGEDIGIIDSKRPNPNLITFRQGQLRAAAAGVGTSYSSSSKDYNGTYSAQRQEMVEQWVHYATLADEFVGNFIQPVWEQFVAAANLSGIVPTPAGIDTSGASEALFVVQQMPWIDPLKEANAWLILTKAGFASEVEVMRRRGVNPEDVLRQVKEWREKCASEGVFFNSDAAFKQAISAAMQPGQ